MRNGLTFSAIALAVTLAGCSKPATETAPAASDAASAAAAASGGADAAAASNKVHPGVFEVSNASGKKLGTTTINADGTYADDNADGHRVAGLVKMVDGKICFDPSGKAPPECFTESAPAADGSFTATDAKGAMLTIRPKAQ